jgi:hypothetical protein
MEKENLRKLLAELYSDFWQEEEKIHGYAYNEHSFSTEAFLRWLSKKPAPINT